MRGAHEGTRRGTSADVHAWWFDRRLAGARWIGQEQASGWPETSEESEVVGHDRGPDVSFEVAEPAPSAAGQAVGALQAGDVGLDAGAEVSELAIDPAALDHVLDCEAAFLVE